MPNSELSFWEQNDARELYITPNFQIKVARHNNAFCFDDDRPDLMNTGVPNPKPPNTCDGPPKSELNPK